MAAAALLAAVALWAELPTAASQAWCCLDSKCTYEDPLVPGVECYGTKDMCVSASCESPGPKPHDTCWGCREGECTPCGCSGVCPGADFPFWDKGECTSRCTGPPAAWWLCEYRCERSGQCSTIATCQSGLTAPCNNADAAARACVGGNGTVYGKPQQYNTSDSCTKDMDGAEVGNYACRPRAAGVPATALHNDPCGDDPSGERHACNEDCLKCREEGSEVWCKVPPAGGGFGCNEGSQCVVIQSRNDCADHCGCAIPPTPNGTCPTKVADENWQKCFTDGGSPDCHWCQDQHKCLPNQGHKFPLGFDEACGKPPTASAGSHSLAPAGPGGVQQDPAPALAETSSSLCTFACSDGTSLLRCTVQDCPDTYDGCPRADCYTVASERCESLAENMYAAGGDVADNRFAGHYSVNYNALHSAAQALLQARQLALSRGENVRDVTPDDIARQVQDLERKGLDVAETSLCSMYVPSNALCAFLVGTQMVQWVNNKIINLPIAAHVTHQIATLAAGAVSKVSDVVNSAVQDVATAINAAKDVAQAVASAATDVVHAALHWFGFSDPVARRAYVSMTSGRLSLPAPAAEPGHSLIAV